MCVRPVWKAWHVKRFYNFIVKQAFSRHCNVEFQEKLPSRDYSPPPLIASCFVNKLIRSNRFIYEFVTER
jgi:hypothetical protein